MYRLEAYIMIGGLAVVAQLMLFYCFIRGRLPATNRIAWVFCPLMIAAWSALRIIKWFEHDQRRRLYFEHYATFAGGVAIGILLCLLIGLITDSCRRK